MKEFLKRIWEHLLPKIQSFWARIKDSKLWPKKRRYTAVLLIGLIVFFLVVLILRPFSAHPLILMIVDVVVLMACGLTVFTVYMNVLLSEHLEDFVGIDEYAFEAAKKYGKARKYIFGVLEYWKVSESLKSALTKCGCDNIVFIGPINERTLPGAIWRLNLNVERVKNVKKGKKGKSSLKPMDIRHIDSVPILFVLIDDNKLLIEYKGIRKGKIFDGTDIGIKKLITDYKTIWDVFYSHYDRLEDGLDRVLYVIRDCIKKNFKSGTYIALEDIYRCIIRVTGFKYNDNYVKGLGEDAFEILLCYYVPKCFQKYTNDFGDPIVIDEELKVYIKTN